MDVFSSAKRSAVMAAVRSAGNKRTELRLAAILKENKLKGWRRNYKIFGKPDFVFRGSRLAIFVDGCFWHRCPLHGSIPATNAQFWSEKLSRNAKRDQAVNAHLDASGWQVIRIWQHELRDSQRVAEKIRQSLAPQIEK
jgi:DNA mismatch endonuclease (patch repair protein)